ncbi:Hypothetical protein CINCED_3A004241 [Cinara cedri]|uniref:Uncharacterized protein n=1 Tax=Cinara cedri TaxID=506608 RepID=A0A5E4NTN8_9HEMI|nr:Hypothetical protein CINCED_3A004241 [Cinara cedri]
MIVVTATTTLFMSLIWLGQSTNAVYYDHGKIFDATVIPVVTKENTLNNPVDQNGGNLPFDISVTQSKTTLPIVGDPLKSNWFPTNHKNTNADGSEKNTSSTAAVDDRMYRLIKNDRPIIHHKKINRVDDQNFNTKTNEFAGKEHVLTGYQKMYDLSYDYLDNPGYKGYYESAADKTAWTTPANRPEQARPLSSWSTAGAISENSGSLVHPTYENENTKPSKLWSIPPTKYLYKLIEYKEKKIDWHKIGMWALIKIGLLKLVKLGVLKILLIILFKFKLYMKAVFLKFLLFLKLLQTVKISMLPLILLPLLPQIIAPIIGGLTHLLTSQIPVLPSIPVHPGNVLPMVLPVSSRFVTPSVSFSGGTAGLSSGTGSSGGTTYSSGSNLSGGTSLSNGIFSDRNPGGTDLTNGSFNIPGETSASTEGSTISIRIPAGGTFQSSFRLDDLYKYFVSKLNYKSLGVFYSTSTTFQNIMNSETCAERIACHIAAAEKTGVLPLWINWPTENTSRRRPAAGVRRVVKFLIVTVVIAIVMLVCIRLGRSMAKTKSSPDERPFVAADDLNATVVEPMVPNSRSLNATVVQTDQVEPRSGVLPIFRHRGTSTGKENSWLNHKYLVGDIVNKTDSIADTGIQNKNNINRQINYDDNSYLETQKWSTEKDGSVGNRDQYDLAYNAAGDYGYNYKQTDAPVTDEIQGYAIDPEPNYPALVYGPSYYRPLENPIISDYQTPSTSYYQPPSTSYYQPPSTSYYQPPSTSYYQPPNTDYQPPSSYYQSPGTQYQPPSLPYPPPSPQYQPPAKKTILRYPTPPSPPPKLVIPVTNKNVVDWKIIFGILTLFKFGLIKLKAFGIIQLLLFLVFILKVFLGILLIKFVLLLKLVKFLKFLLMPQLFFLLGLPVITSMLSPIVLTTMMSIPGRIMNMLKEPSNSTMMPVSMMPVSMIPYSMIPSRFSETIPSVSRPNIPSTSSSTSSLQTRPVGGSSGSGGGSMSSSLSSTISRPSMGPSANTVTLPNGTRYTVRPEDLIPNTMQTGLPVNNRRALNFSKIDNVNLLYNRYNESLSKNSNTLDIVHDVLNSDKCLERIACRLAVSEKPGVTPPWINWILKSVSNTINSENLKSYSKTYNDVKNTVLQTNSSAPDNNNWSTWCSERPENESGKKPTKCVTRVMIMLGILLVVVASITLLYTLSYLQQVIPLAEDALVPADNVHGMADVLFTTAAHNRDKLFAVKLPGLITTTTKDVVPDGEDIQNPEEILETNILSPITLTTSGEEEVKNDLTVKLPSVPTLATSRSLNSDIVTILKRSDNFVVEPLITKNVILPLVVGENMTNKNLRSIDYSENNTTVDNENEKDQDTEDTAKNQTNERQFTKHRQLNYENYTNIEAAKLVVEEDVSSGYQSSYEQNYNLDDYVYRKQENPAVGTGWTKDQRSETTDGSSNNWDSSAHENGNNRQSVRPPPSALSKYPKSEIEVHKEFKIDWQRIGILALIKLGLTKLQAVGFLKMVFLLLFKFKLYLVAIFFKFVLFLKLIKSFNIMLIPFFFFKFLPTLINLFYYTIGQIYRTPQMQQTQQMQQLMKQMERLGQLPSNAGIVPVFNPETDQDFVSAINPGIVQRPSSVISRPGVLRPSGMITRNRFPGETITTLVPGGIVPTGGISGETVVNRIPSGSLMLPSLRLNSIINGQESSALELYHPIFGVFRRVLDSEKCVERIACRIAVVEKTGMMPFWIDWIMHRVSTLIPNDKLETYLKTYKDVNHTFHTNSMTPDSWATWCLERYECNGDDASINNVADTYQPF